VFEEFEGVEEVETFAGEFASAMQELSAEAEKKLPESSSKDSGVNAAVTTLLAQIAREFYGLNSRIESMEVTLAKRMEELANPRPITDIFDLARQFKKVDAQLDAIRTAEGVNQRLFDSMHRELKEYRDNFLHETLQKPFIRDLIVLFDDLTSLASQLKAVGKAEGKRQSLKRLVDNLENAIHGLVEILHRLEVNEIPQKETVDLTLHRVVSYEPTDFAEEDGRIVMRLKRGFLWRDGVLRPEEVIAKRYN
jgi:molecular chaperone GrpE (heat shock protein)